VLSGRGLCVGLIARPEESYRVWCVSECDREASITRRPWPTGGCHAMEITNVAYLFNYAHSKYTKERMKATSVLSLTF
jgi:hypothetical protein